MDIQATTDSDFVLKIPDPPPFIVQFVVNYPTVIQLADEHGNIIDKFELKGDVLYRMLKDAANADDADEGRGE